MGCRNRPIVAIAPDDVRGRVLSVWSMIAAGVLPLGSLLLGGLASLTSRVAPGVGVVARDPRRGAAQAEEAVVTGAAAS